MSPKPKMQYVEIGFSNGLRFRLLPEFGRAQVFQEHRGEMHDLVSLSMRELIDATNKILEEKRATEGEQLANADE
jgi:hypothetical protein